MKKTIFGFMTLLALMAFTMNSTASESTDDNGTTTTKCGGDKTAKCGVGKCGGGK